METKKLNETEKQIKDRIVSFINYSLGQDESDGTYHAFYGFYVSNFNKVCDKSDLADRLAEELMQASKDVKTDFMDEFDVYSIDGTVRVCDHCGKFMFEGYYLAGEYACSEECAVELYPDTMSREEREQQFKDDLQFDEDNCTGECYWTEW